jgi:putative membrane protein
MIRFILHAIASAVGFWLASKIVPGVHVGGLGSLLAAGLVLGIVNALVRPVLVFLTFPLTLITLGLFLLVVNGMMVSLVAFFLRHGVHIDSFWHALLASLVISVTGWLVGGLTGWGEERRR